MWRTHFSVHQENNALTKALPSHPLFSSPIPYKAIPLIITVKLLKAQN
jgi:hypothetical protein